MFNLFMFIMLALFVGSVAIKLLFLAAIAGAGVVVMGSAWLIYRLGSSRRS